jgi:competence protein ComEC
VPLVMLCCAVAAPVGAVDIAAHVPVLGEAATWLSGGSAWLYLDLMILAGKAAAAVPLASVPISVPAWLAVAWYPLLTVVWLRPRPAPVAPDPLQNLELVAPRAPPAALPLMLRRMLRPRGLLAMSTVLLGIVSLAALPDGRLHLTMLDIGQGDAILIESPSGATMLIDGGPDPDLALRRIGEALPFFQHRIDVVMLTHPHQDHVAGLVEVLRRYRVGLVLDSGRAFANPTYARFVALAGRRLRNARTGLQLTLDQRTTFTILYPDQADADGPLPDDDINNASVVGILRCDAFSALLTGDAEAPVEARLAERGLLQPVDVLKVGHHGSRSSTSPAMLAGARPSIGLISDGVDNDYGHPAPQTLAALTDAGVRVRRTDLEGNVEVTSDGKAYEVISRVAHDPNRPVRALVRAREDAGSIGPWRYPDSTTLARSLQALTYPPGSWSIPRASVASPPRQPGWCARPAFRSTSASSRSPPCCTTSTSCSRVPAARSTASSAPAG